MRDATCGVILELSFSCRVTSYVLCPLTAATQCPWACCAEDASTPAVDSHVSLTTR